MTSDEVTENLAALYEAAVRAITKDINNPRNGRVWFGKICEMKADADEKLEEAIDDGVEPLSVGKAKRIYRFMAGDCSKKRHFSDMPSEHERAAKLIADEPATFLLAKLLAVTIVHAKGIEALDSLDLEDDAEEAEANDDPELAEELRMLDEEVTEIKTHLEENYGHREELQDAILEGDEDEINEIVSNGLYSL